MVSLVCKIMLSAANSKDSKVESIKVVGSSELPCAFDLANGVFSDVVRVVEGQPYGLVLGAAFLRRHNSVFSFSEEGSFKPTPESLCTPFAPSEGGCAMPSKGSTVWQAAIKPIPYLGGKTYRSEKLDSSMVMLPYVERSL